jgi:rsbT co-antagonist protein RsbR
MGFISRLTTVSHPDQHIRRRGRLLATVLLAIIVLAVLFLLVTLRNPNSLPQVAIILVCMGLYAGMLRLAHAGYVTLSGWLFCATLIGSIAATMLAGGSGTSLYYMVLAIIAAALVLPPAHIWTILAVLMAAIGAAIFGLDPALRAEAFQTHLPGATILFVGCAFMSYLGAKATERALDSADQNAQHAEAAQQKAEAQALELEQQAVALSTAEERLRNLVATLETPAVELADGILLAPLIGAVDSRRALMLTERLLATISEQRVRLLILDIAGVAMIDTAVTQTLLKITQMVRLLGCNVVLTGVSAEVAVSITSLGVNLADIETARSPQEVLATHRLIGAAPR